MMMVATEHPAVAEPVDQDAGRHLHGRVDTQLQHDEGAELTRGEVQPFGGLRSGHAERCAMEDGEQVNPDADAQITIGRRASEVRAE